MPNYNITIDSKFDPYSFEDYLKPAMLMQEQHNQAADAYANYLAQSAGMEEALAANPNDIDLLNQYNTYRQTLNALADDLSRNGISRATRRGAFQAKADYGNIAKMQEAIKTRDELLRERRGLRIQDPSLIFSNEDSDYSIKNVMAGKTNYDALSKNVIMKDVEDRAKNWAKSAMIHMQQNDIIDPQSIKYGYIFRKILNGATPQEIVGAINSGEVEGVKPGDPIVSELKSIVDASVDKYISAGARDANGQSVWEDRRGDIRNAAAQGLWSALGDIDYSPIQNLMEKYDRSSKALKGETFNGYSYDVQTGVSSENPDLNGINKIQNGIPYDVLNNLNTSESGSFWGLGLDPNLNPDASFAEKKAREWTLKHATQNYDNFLNSDFLKTNLTEDEKTNFARLYNDILKKSKVMVNDDLSYKNIDVDKFKKVCEEFRDYTQGLIVLSHADVVTGLTPEFYENFRARIDALTSGDSLRELTGVDKNGKVQGKVVDAHELGDWFDMAEKDPSHITYNIKLIDDVIDIKDAKNKENGEIIYDANGNPKKEKTHNQRQVIEFVDNSGSVTKRKHFLIPDISVDDDNKQAWRIQYAAKDDLEEMQNDKLFMASVKRGESGVGNEKDRQNYNIWLTTWLSANAMQDDNIKRFVDSFPTQKPLVKSNNKSVGYQKEETGSSSNNSGYNNEF